MHVWMSLGPILNSHGTSHHLRLVKEVEMMLSLIHKTALVGHPLVLTIQILKIPQCHTALQRFSTSSNLETDLNVLGSGS